MRCAVLALASQIKTANLDDRKNLNERFVANNWTGAIMFATVLAGQLL